MDSGDCRQNCGVTLPDALREGDKMMYGRDNSRKKELVHSRDGMDSGDCRQNRGVTLPNALREGDEMMYGGGTDSGDCRQNCGVTLPGALREGDEVTCEQDNAQKKELE
ncbi:hypothetical protein BS47DRAFT_1359097 [Hydnum rufescens UP504]|uniref:Uncharacterized protein n=1 Tax=Hydnum rufescens UP504 TaxID=1448309 RepID=A0A9P6E178_9AGAM|nr:hypothetical protein BS47DRAFT_1359097 [Hydnum rufescens UP504]